MENERLNRVYSYLFYGASVAILIVSILMFNAILLVISVALLSFSAIYFKSGHIVNNFLLGKSRVIEKYNGYVLNRNLVSASKRIDGGYLSLSIALMRPENAINIGSEAFKGLIESIREDFEFSVLVRHADKRKMLESLEYKKNLKEIELSRMNPKQQTRINGTRREIEILGSEIKKIGGGGKAFYITLELKAFADSESESKAASESSRNLESIAGAFSARLGFSYETLRGEALLNFLEANA